MTVPCNEVSASVRLASWHGELADRSRVIGYETADDRAIDALLDYCLTLIAELSGGNRASGRGGDDLRPVALAVVAEDYEDFRFNTAIATMMELTNAIIRGRDAGQADGKAYAEAVDTLLLLLAPVAPHVTEELWERRGHEYSIHQQSWPEADSSLTRTDTLELPVQVDGKLRDRLVVTPETPPEEIERMALASPHVQRYLAGRAPRRVIQIPGKLVNVVTPPVAR